MSESHPEEPFYIMGGGPIGGCINFGLALQYFYGANKAKREALAVDNVDGSVYHSAADERAVMRAANRIVRMSGERVEQELGRDMQHIAREVDSSVSPEVETRLATMYVAPSTE